MSPESHNTKPAQMRRRLADMSLRFKLYIGVGTLIAGLLLVSGITAYTGVTTQQLVRRTLVRQSQLTNLTTNVSNNLLNIQNQAFEFYNVWTRTGFELDVDPGTFDYARESYLDPLQAQLDQMRSDITAIQQLEPDLETYADLEKILTSIQAYEASLLDMSDQMESLGYRDSGELGQLQQIITELQNRLQETDLEAIKTNLAQMDQYAKSFFLRSELIYIRLVRESIQELHKQIAAIDDTQLSPSVKAELDEMLEDYYDHILVAANLHSKLHENRGNLIGQSDLVSTLVQRLFEQQRADFSASIKQFQSQQSSTAITTVGLALFILLSGTVIAYFVTNQVIQPIQALGQAAERLGAGELNVRASIPGRDEIGATATAFDLMADQLQELLAGLEQRVTERTRDLEATTADLVARSAELEKAHQLQQQINRQLEQAVHQNQRRATLLQASAEVSHAVTQIRDLDELLPQVTQLISQHFGFYHAGIFLVDEGGRYAVLHAANSEGGQRMLARQHKLGVGSEGIVGYVTGAGQPRIALDVGADAVYFDNPDMPDTRSEMAVPLQIGGEIMGALDVQSTAEAAFDEQDVQVLTALADQIAIAIQNIHLFQQTQTALEKARQAQTTYLQQEWSQFTREQQDLSYEYTLSGVPPIGDAPLYEAQQALLKGDLVVADGANDHRETMDDHGSTLARAALAAPIKYRGQTIGVLDLQETDDERIWTEDEIALVQAVADQLGQALEGARLFEQTQASLAETQTLFETSRSLAAAQETEDIWQAIINAARQRRADACALFLFDTLERETAHALVLTTAWEQHDPIRLPVGTRLPLGDFDRFDTMRPDRHFCVTDLAQADKLNEGTRRLMTSLGFSALLHQPIAVRDRWFGILTILYQMPHSFTEAEINFYRTLADQSALAIEGQRLLTETQHRAEREQLIRQITDKVRATSNLESILQTTVQELSKAMGLPRAFIRLGLEQDLIQPEQK